MGRTFRFERAAAGTGVTYEDRVASSGLRPGSLQLRDFSLNRLTPAASATVR
jgi:hypothetical protein